MIFDLTSHSSHGQKKDKKIAGTHKYEKNTAFGAAFEATALIIIRLIRYKLISISNKAAKRSLMENDSQQVEKSILLSVTEKDGMG